MCYSAGSVRDKSVWPTRRAPKHAHICTPLIFATPGKPCCSVLPQATRNATQIVTLAWTVFIQGLYSRLSSGWIKSRPTDLRITPTLIYSDGRVHVPHGYRNATPVKYASVCANFVLIKLSGGLLLSPPNTSRSLYYLKNAKTIFSKRSDLLLREWPRQSSAGNHSTKNVMP